MSDETTLKPGMLRQVACYWAPGGVDEYGRKAYADPIEINCRWEDTQEAFLDPAGNTQVSKSKVYVDRDLGLLGVIWLSSVLVGEGAGAALAELTDPAVPMANPGATEVRGVYKLPTRAATKFLRWVML